jgi:MFS family permease
MQHGPDEADDVQVIAPSDGERGSLVNSRRTLAALRAVWSNESVRRSQLALAGSTIGNWSYSVAFSVLVYDRAGATWVGLAQVFRLVPAALAAPFLASIVDRYPRQRVLLLTDASRALIMAGFFVCAALTGPLAILIGLATVNTLVGTLFWPAQGAMLPTLVDEPEELTACNVGQSTIESLGSVIGPALGGSALAAFGTTIAFGVPVVAYTLSAIAVTRVHPRSRAADEAAAEPGDEEGADEPSHGILAGLAAIVRHGDVRVLVGLYGAQVLVCGALNVLTVVTALELLDAGDSGVGALVAALGVGGILGALPALVLAQRARLTTVFVWGLVLWGAPIALIALAKSLPLALAMMVLVGVGNTLVDVSAVTLLQRATPGELLGRVFGVLESIVIASVALGSAIAPALLDLAGVRATLVATGVLLPLVALPLWHRLRRLDVATVDARRMELLRDDPIFAPLPSSMLEQLAQALEPVSLAPGEVLFHAGDAGDRYYLIEDGSVRISPPGDADVTLEAGAAFGEIALIRDVPRTATVTATAPTTLLALRGDEFVSAVTGHPTSAAAADAVISTRLHSLRPALASA